MDQNFKASLKSSETEDWLDLHVIRPFCYYCALAFAKFDIHPNTVTIWSMIIGAASTVFFATGSYYYSGWWGLGMNLVAVFMLMVADILDCTDGQLARLTGKKSPLGRILDGAAGFVWFVPIYLGMVYRFYQHHTIEFSWLGIPDTYQNVLIATGVVLVLSCISGFVGISGQQRLADYYIQVHLFFLKGEKGSELDNSRRQQEIYDQMDASTPWVVALTKYPIPCVRNSSRLRVLSSSGTDCLPSISVLFGSSCCVCLTYQPATSCSRFSAWVCWPAMSISAMRLSVVV